MDMGNYFNISRPFSKQTTHYQINDLGIWGNGNFGNFSNKHGHVNKQEISDNSDEDSKQVLYGSEDSLVESDIVGDDRHIGQQHMGNGFNIESSDITSRQSIDELVERIYKRIYEYGASERTGRIHDQRIRNVLVKVANKINIDPVDLVTEFPEKLIQEMNDLYKAGVYKANTIKNFYSSIKHLISVLDISEEKRKHLLQLIDTEFAKNEVKGHHEVQTYKNELTYINPKEVYNLANEKLSRSKDIPTLITVLLYAVFPLRDDITNIKMFSDTVPLNQNGILFLPDSNVYLVLNKTKTIPVKYPPCALKLDENLSRLLIERRIFANKNKQILLPGRGSVRLQRFFKRYNVKVKGGAVNYMRRCHAKHANSDDLDKLLFIMGHNAKTHGKHYL